MEKKETVKQEIIEAARQLFSRYGFRKTTMEDIARVTHKGKSSLYYYFKNKEEVFRAVIIYEASILRKALKDATTGISDQAEKLEKYMKVRMHTMKELINYYDAVEHEHDSHYSFIDQLRDQFDQDEAQAIRRILDEGVEQDKFQPLDTELAANTLVIAMKGLEYPLVWKGSAQDLDKRIRKIMKILFYGLLKR